MPVCKQSWFEIKEANQMLSDVKLVTVPECQKQLLLTRLFARGCESRETAVIKFQFTLIHYVEVEALESRWRFILLC